MRGRPFKKGQKPHNYNPVTIICQFCGKEFLVCKSREKTAKHCSRKCHNTAISRNYDHSGSKNSRWKGGVQTYRKFKKSLCERCGSAKYLVIHHKDKNRYNNELSNLETVCKRCHQIEHNCIANLGSYAKRVSDPEQRVSET